MQQIQLHNISYNDAIGAFEARVDVTRPMGTFRYPCRLAAPRNTEEEQVRFGLATQALRMSDSPIPMDSTEILM